MPDFLSIFSRWWKMITGFVLAIAVITVILLLQVDKQYVSTVTALPATTVNFDKSRIFGENIQGLYSPLGGPEDIDRVLGTAGLDTIFLQMIRENGLIRHYKIKEKKIPEYYALKEFSENVEVLKDEYGQLRIKVWDKDKYLASRMANALYAKYQDLHQRLQSETNERILGNLRQHQGRLQQEYVRNYDSMTVTGAAQRDLLRVRNESLIKELADYERLINEYALVSNTRPNVLLLVEPARPAFKTDRPRLLPTFITVCFVALIFALLLSLYLDSRKKD
ncbi:hypothetical protein [Flaviaesturariibacter amylovorans]|uniref:Polysaccharide chain length determinant N-terminal domain-containing protein n=1 Tax=Flaviaesturariibacter amylovorans TaxID=1084520 RepID=A0ABP8HPV9_9BACT